MRLVDIDKSQPLHSFATAISWLRTNCDIPCDDYEGAVGEFLSGGHYDYVDDFRFKAGGPRVFDEDGFTFVNTFTGWNSAPGDVQPFLDLTEAAFVSCKQDAEWLIDLIAYHVQNPDVHIPYAGAITGERLPADLWVSAIYEAFAPWSVRFGVVHLRSTNKAWMRNSVIGVMNGVANGIEDRISAQILCQIIIAPDARVINDASKNRSFSRNEVNNLLILCTLPNGKDRLLGNAGIFYSIPARKVDEEILGRFQKWVRDGNARHLAHWLFNRDVSHFKPPVTAPLTQSARVSFLETMTPFQRLAYVMRESPENYIAQWISNSLQWASQMSMANAKSRTSIATKNYALVILETFPELTVRPWYTADEIILMFPDMFTQHPDFSKWGTFSENLVSGELRTGGLTMLQPENGKMGFMHNNKLNNYFIIHNEKDWIQPVSQDRFDELMKSWPSYREYQKQQAKGPHEQKA